MLLGPIINQQPIIDNLANVTARITYVKTLRGQLPLLR